MSHRPSSLHALAILSSLALLTACNVEDATTSEGDWVLGEGDMGEDPRDMSQAPQPDQGALPDADMEVIPPLCGNGVVDDGETCDGSCPEPGECNVQDMGSGSCTQLIYNGSPRTCSAECILVEETRCTSGDGCCPSNCSSAEDDDCAPDPEPVCGNGQVEEGELCDGNCPVSVDDCPEIPLQDVCSAPALVGQGCQIMCGVRRITEYNDFDGCCPDGGTPARDSDCVPDQICGDGVVQPGEACDGDCPMSDLDCDDQNACTSDTVSGDAATCMAMCTSTPITSCTSGDGCCPAGCEAQGDMDCFEVDLCMQPVPSPSPYGPASVLSIFELGDADTGFDFTGDNMADNAFGSLVDTLGSLTGGSRQDYNLLIAQQINSGQLAILLEYSGLSGLSNPATFTTHMLSGSPRCFAAPASPGGNFYDVKPSSYNSVGQPNAQLASTWLPTLDAISGSALPGAVFMVELGFAGVTLNLPVREILYAANVDRAVSALPAVGVFLENGLLGGIIKLEDFYGAINTFVNTSCACVTFSSPSMELFQGGTNATCNNNVSASQCGGGNIEGICRQLVDNCGLLTAFLPSFVDVDSNALNTDCTNAGTCDSLSIGFDFKAAGARIVGVTTN